MSKKRVRYIIYVLIFLLTVGVIIRINISSTPSKYEKVDPKTGMTDFQYQRYMNDSGKLSNNTYKGSLALKKELREKILTSMMIQDFIAYDYTNAHTKGDIYPEYINPIKIEYTSAKGVENGPVSIKYFQGSELMLKQYSIPKMDQETFVDAAFLAKFLSEENYKIFATSLKRHSMDMNSYVKIKIIHCSHAFDNLEPNYFSSFVYAHKIRNEINDLNVEFIKKIDTRTYEVSNKNTEEFPTINGRKVVEYKNRIIFDTGDSFTVERYGDNVLIYKIIFKMGGNPENIGPHVADLEELNYNENYVNPNK